MRKRSLSSYCSARGGEVKSERRVKNLERFLEGKGRRGKEMGLNYAFNYLEKLKQKWDSEVENKENEE